MRAQGSRQPQWIIKERQRRYNQPDADVHQGGRLAGHISRTAEGSHLWFERDFLTSHPAFPGRLAWQIPYSEKGILQTGENLHSFFVNLLPEGVRLQMLMENSRLAKDDLLGMLMVVGADAVGDVSIVKAGTPMKQDQPPVLASRSRAISFWEVFYQTAGRERDSAISGVQEKVSSSTVSFGVRREGGSAAILKLSPKRYPLLVENEHYFLRAARACGIDTAQARILKDREDESGLLVDRFDREFSAQGQMRLHQEDLCQILGEIPANKYDISFQQALRAADAVCSAPQVEKMRLMRLYIFCWMIGNADLHAKNISFYWKDGLIRMTPAYDVLSTLPYGLDEHMAMKMYGKDSDFKARDFIECAVRAGIPEKASARIIPQTAAKLAPWLDRLGEIGFEEAVTQKMKAAITKRVARLAD